VVAEEMQSDFFSLHYTFPFSFPPVIQRKDCIRLRLVVAAFLFSPQFGMARWKREKERLRNKENNGRLSRWSGREIENLISYKFWERRCFISLWVSSFKLVISAKLPQLHSSVRPRSFFPFHRLILVFLRISSHSPWYHLDLNNRGEHYINYTNELRQGICSVTFIASLQRRSHPRKGRHKHQWVMYRQW